MTWQVYDNPAEAITGLSVHATIGSQQLTIGSRPAGAAALGGSYLASLDAPDPADGTRAARCHGHRRQYLNHLFVALRFGRQWLCAGAGGARRRPHQMTLLVSALGVGIGFGLQTRLWFHPCGLILLLERPPRVGDTIEIGGQLVKIAKIGLRATTVQATRRI